MKRVKLTALISLFITLALLGGSAQATFGPDNTSEGQNIGPSVISFVGTLIEFHHVPGLGTPYSWTVKVDRVLFGPRDITPSVEVVTFQSTAPPWGAVDPDLKAFDRVWVFGQIVSNSEITLHGSKYYYIEKGPREIELVGTALAFHKQGGFGNGSYWTIKVNNVLCGPHPCNRVINVTTSASISPIPWGCSDPRISPGDKVVVFGTYHTIETLMPGKCGIWLFGSKKYFIKEYVKPKHLENEGFIMT